MKILFVYRFCGLGGVETSILNKLAALSDAGVGGHALFAEFYGSGGHSLATSKRVTVGFTRESVRALLRREFDAISVTDYPEFIDLLEEIGATAPIVFETATSIPSSMPRLHRRLDDPRIAAVVVPSLFNRRIVESRVASPALVTVIPNPVDDRVFHLRMDAGVSAQPSRFDAPTLVWIGRLEDEKNPLEFMRIGEALLASGSDVQLVLVGDAYGDAEHADYTRRLRAAVAPRWLDRFTFRRSVPHEEMPHLYSLAARTGGCLVSTSLYESAPMIFVEAMSCMCPVVASDVGGVREMLADGVTARLYQPGDLPRAVAAVQTLVDPEQRAARAEMVRAAKALANGHYSPHRTAAEYVGLVQSLAVRRPERHAVTVGATDPGEGPSRIPGLVSAIIPVYNRAGLLREAVASVLAQTWPAIEIVIVDDGSNDGTSEVCDELAADYPVIKVLHAGHSGRAGLARELGRAVARGEFVQYLDSDDLIMPTKFERLIAGLRANPECEIAYCYTRRYRIGGSPVDVATERTGETLERLGPCFLNRRLWCTSTPLYRAAICDDAGPWSDLPFWEDIEYDARLAIRAPRLYHCREWLTDMRDHDLGRLSGSRFLEDSSLLQHAVRGALRIYQSAGATGVSSGDPDLHSFIDDVRLLHDRCEDFNLDQAARDCARIVTHATGERPSRLGLDSVRADIEPRISVLRVGAGHSVRCPVRITNRSTVAFHGGEFATEVSYHLFETDGRVLRFENPEREIFHRPLGPGDTRDIDVWIHAPEARGLYYAQLDILWAGARWLGATGDSTSYVKLLVTEREAERRWRLHVEPGNDASLVFPGRPAGTVRLSVREASTAVPWHIQLNHERIAIVRMQPYELTFRVRAECRRSMFVGISRAHEPWDNLGLYQQVELSPDWRTISLPFTGRESDDNARVHFDAGGVQISVDVQDVDLRGAPGGESVIAPLFCLPGRLQMDIGVHPASNQWGTDRGLPVHRYYVEQFLAEFASDMRGRCLEFQDPQYTPRFGESVETLDILHVDGSSPHATLVADLTKPNRLPSCTFDCIVCTHVLHVIVDLDRALAELFRILRPGGVLLVAVPHISMYGPEYQEIWRFTPRGLDALLSRAFGAANVLIKAYGNSLTAAGEIRGVVASEFLTGELNSHDPRFPVEVCARAVKRV